ncbi:MAG: response regulator [Chloroflexota bacterium]
MMTNILVIEDETDIRNDIAEVLSYENFICVVAPNGRAGVQSAHDYLPDLIICDIMMPVMDGYEVLDALRNDPSTANIPFVFLTAKADRESVRYGMASGADDYLTKPFTSNELLTAVKARLEKKASLISEFTHRVDHLRQALIHGLPHELRTPLSGILGGAELLLKDSTVSESEDLTELAHMIFDCGKRLQRQVENYLFYAQLQIIRSDIEQLSNLKQSSTDTAGAVIRDVVREKARIVERSGDLVMDVQEGVVSISTDNLKKIVEELADNAFKFSKVGSRVTISAVVKDDSYVLSINDLGRGMSTEEMNNVEALMQFGRELYEQQGSGLGLAIVQQLVELHGGKFSIESDPERGTRVCAKLPIHPYIGT